MAGLLVYIRLVFPLRYEAFITCLTNMRPLMSFYRPGKSQLDLFLIFRDLIFFGTIPLSILIALRLLGNESIQASDWVNYIAILATVWIVMSIQKGTLLVLGWTFQSLNDVRNMIYTRSFSVRWISFVMLPLNFLALFAARSGPWMAYVVLIILTVSYLFSVFRSIRTNGPKFLMRPGLLFYYFCGLEILPWLVVFSHWEDLWRWSAFSV